MVDFMHELLKQQESLSKTKVTPVQAKTESKIESTTIVNGEKVKTETGVKSETKEITTKFTSEKTSYVSFDLGATVNLSNFNMGKVNVSISMPVGTEITPEFLKKLDSTYDFMKAYAEKKVETEVKELLALRGK